MSAITTLSILKGVSTEFEISIDAILSSGIASGRKPTAENTARNVVYYLAYLLLGKSYADIGKELNKNHSTVLSGYRRINEMVEADPEFAARIVRLEQRLRLAGESHVNKTDLARKMAVDGHDADDIRSTLNGTTTPQHIGSIIAMLRSEGLLDSPSDAGLLNKSACDLHLEDLRATGLTEWPGIRKTTGKVSVGMRLAPAVPMSCIGSSSAMCAEG